MKDAWAVIRPYITPVRVAAVLTALLGPPFAILIAKLAVVLAGWGINLDPTQATIVFGAAALAAGGMIAHAVVKFIDSRTQFETALINNGQTDLIGGKSISTITGQADPALGGSPGPDVSGGPDDDYLLSQPDDIHPDDA